MANSSEILQRSRCDSMLIEYMSRRGALQSSTLVSLRHEDAPPIPDQIKTIQLFDRYVCISPRTCEEDGSLCWHFSAASEHFTTRIVMLRHSTIFATVREHEAPPAEDSHRYHKAEYSWSFGIESRLRLGVGRLEAAEYGSYWDEDAGCHQVLPLTESEGGPILGRIAISDTWHESPDQFSHVLQTRLQKPQSYLDADSDSEDWFNHALQELQDCKVLHKFDRDAFFKYAHAYLADRSSDATDVPYTVVYPELHSHMRRLHK